MVHHSVDLDLASALAAPRHCPVCRSLDLLPVTDAQGVLFLCQSCSRTWVSELGTLSAAEGVRPSEAPAVPAPRARRTR